MNPRRRNHQCVAFGRMALWSGLLGTPGRMASGNTGGQPGTASRLPSRVSETLSERLTKPMSASMATARVVKQRSAVMPTHGRYHPRAERTNKTNVVRIKAVRDVPLEGQPMCSWLLRELGRKHAAELVRALLVDQRRAPGGASAIIRTLSALFEDAIVDGEADQNPFRGLRVRASDPRITKPPKEIRVWSFQEMHDFADSAALPRLALDGTEVCRTPRQAVAEIQAGRYRQAMIRTLSDTGLRLGEMLALRREDYDGDYIRSRGNAFNGVITEGDTETKKHVRAVPCPPGLAEILDALPVRIDSELLFPTARGNVWSQRNFYRAVWDPARRRTGLPITPHECRHSYISHLRTDDGVDDADLARIAGHELGTMLAHYAHALDRSDDNIRQVIG